MPRYPRALVAGSAHHIVQRGHDRQPVFATEDDCRLYLENLTEQLQHLDVALYAWCLMTNHVHLLVQPQRHGADLSRLMRIVAARQTRHVNRLEGRTGTLWESRFKCSLVDTNGYLLACCRYIELNPVRAGMVGRPDDYRWSSYAARVGDQASPVPLTTPESYLALGADDAARRRRYRSFVASGVGADEATAIRAAVRRNQITGGEAFKARIEQKLGRRLSTRGPGRPGRCPENKPGTF